MLKECIGIVPEEQWTDFKSDSYFKNVKFIPVQNAFNRDIMIRSMLIQLHSMAGNNPKNFQINYEHSDIQNQLNEDGLSVTPLNDVWGYVDSEGYLHVYSEEGGIDSFNTNVINLYVSTDFTWFAATVNVNNEIYTIHMDVKLK